MEKQSELRNKYQQSDEAATQPELFRRRSEMSDAERYLHYRVNYIRKPNRSEGINFTYSTTRCSSPTCLREAWKQVKANAGAPGVDNVTIKDVEKQGLTSILQNWGKT
jgi:hypothetical protein